MKKICIIVLSAFILSAVVTAAHADGSNIAVLRNGLVGAGTGAIATAMTGSKGDAVWRGALLGMGVNVVGGALLDVIATPSQNQAVAYISNPQPVRYVTVVQPARPVRTQVSARRRVYRAGYRNGYAQGYGEGYYNGYSDGYNAALYY
jgi:hypothetical protein